MIEFKELLEYCQAEAIANKINPTEGSTWRDLCRTYSEAFHTPLYMVLEMDPEHVILNVYEKQTENMDIEDYNKLEHILDTLKTIEDPNYEAVKNKEQEEFDRRAEEEEELRVKENRPVYVPKKKTLSKTTTPPEKKLPSGGMIDLSYLSKADQE